MSSHRPQHTRSRGLKPSLVLQERDTAMLRAVAENRFLTTSLVARLFPPDPERVPRHAIEAAKTKYLERHPGHVFHPQPGTNVERRLAKLFHHGYLDRLRTVRGGELVYALTWKGDHLLARRRLEAGVDLTPEERERRRRAWAEKNRDLADAFIEHTIMVATFRTALLEAVRQAKTVELVDFQREGDHLRAVWNVPPHTLHDLCRESHKDPRRMAINPDAFLTLRDERPEPVSFFLEADRSTETTKRLLEKFVHYARLYADRRHQDVFGVASFRVLTVARSSERASNLVWLLAAPGSPIPADLRDRFLFTTAQSYADHSTDILSAIWRAPDQPAESRAIVASPLPRRGRPQ